MKCFRVGVSSLFFLKVFSFKKKKMPTLPVATFFQDPNGRVLTETQIVFFDPITKVIVLDKSVCKKLSKGSVFEAGHLLEWNKERDISTVSLETMRIAMANDEDIRFADDETARRILKERVTSAPREMTDLTYIASTSCLAFPVKERDPIVMRKGEDTSLSTLTLFENYVPHGDPSFVYLMPHLLRMSPPALDIGDGLPVKEEVVRILSQRFTYGVSPSLLKGMKFALRRQSEEESVFSLFLPHPICIYNFTKKNQTVLRSIR